MYFIKTSIRYDVFIERTAEDHDRLYYYINQSKVILFSKKRIGRFSFSLEPIDTQFMYIEFYDSDDNILKVVIVNLIESEFPNIVSRQVGVCNNFQYNHNHQFEFPFYLTNDNITYNLITYRFEQLYCQNINLGSIILA